MSCLGQDTFHRLRRRSMWPGLSTGGSRLVCGAPDEPASSSDHFRADPASGQTPSAACHMRATGPRTPTSSRPTGRARRRSRCCTIRRAIVGTGPCSPPMGAITRRSCCCGRLRRRSPHTPFVRSTLIVSAPEAMAGEVATPDSLSDLDGEAHKAYNLDRTLALILVRLDGHIAFRGPADCPDALRSYCGGSSRHLRKGRR